MALVKSSENPLPKRDTDCEFLNTNIHERVRLGLRFNASFQSKAVCDRSSTRCHKTGSGLDLTKDRKSRIGVSYGINDGGSLGLSSAFDRFAA